MRCLLIYPRFSRFTFWNYSLTCELAGYKYPTSPLGLLTVAALLPREWECRLADLNTRELEPGELEWADLVLIGGMITQQPEILRWVRLARAAGKPVAVGGPDPTSQPEVYREADYLVLDEGEITVPLFLKAFRAGERSGIFRSGGSRPALDAVPVPRFDLIRFADYHYIGVQSSRGCPYQCEFCDIIELYGRVPRVKPPERVTAELEALYRAGHRGHVDFVDDNFIGNKKAAKELLAAVIRWSESRGWPFFFSTEATITLAQDEELLALMRRCDFRHVFIGIETPDPELLRTTRKGQNALAPIVDSVRRVHRAGMVVYAGFIVGFDGERPGAADAIVRLIEETGICAATVGLLTSLPNTALDRRLRAESRLLTPGPVYVRSTEIDASTGGLNFRTSRPRAEILSEYRSALERLYSPEAYFSRLDRLLGDLRPACRPRSVGGLLGRYAMAFARISWACARRREVGARYLRALAAAALRGKDHLTQAVALSAMYLHLQDHARHVISHLGAEIRRLESLGEEACLQAIQRERDEAAAAVQPTVAPVAAHLVLE